jgi:hypothetical protein
VRSLNVLINFARTLAKPRKLDDPASSRSELEVARPYTLNFANENYERRTGADSEPIPSSPSGEEEGKGDSEISIRDWAISPIPCITKISLLGDGHLISSDCAYPD